ncbi:MAG: ABC transporter [Clostridiales bacterium]|nr:MAG: ABC transporter [Clostridiales bacterium]
MPKINIQNITKRFASKVVFEDFSVTFDAAKNTAILGASGQGKTTLLNLLAGIEKVDSGAIDRGGLKFSYVFQEPVLLPWATVYQNLQYVAKDERAHNRILEVLEKLSLRDELDAYPAELSGGMKQRVALARAVLFEADVILMDEPFQNLDAQSKASAIELYKTLRAQSNINFIIVTHNIDEALSVADNLLILKGEKNKQARFYEDKKTFVR